jgi:anti-anti-sigma factor
LAREAIRIEPFRIRVSQLQNATVIACRGEVDLATVASLEISVDAALERPIVMLVLDLEEVSFMDSSGIAFLVRTTRRFAESDVHLEVWPSTDVRRICALVGVSLPRASYPAPARAALALEAS